MKLKKFLKKHMVTNNSFVTIKDNGLDVFVSEYPSVILKSKSKSHDNEASEIYTSVNGIININTYVEEKKSKPKKDKDKTKDKESKKAKGKDKESKPDTDKK